MAPAAPISTWQPATSAAKVARRYHQSYGTGRQQRQRQLALSQALFLLRG
jgi:hypothetical protein